MEFLWAYVGSSELVIFFGVIFIVLLCHSLLVPLFYWHKRGVPYITAIPLFGNMANSVLQRVFIGEIYMQMYNQLEGKRYGGFLKFCKPGVIVRDPKLIKSVLEMAFPSFHDNDLAVNEDLEDLLNQNLFALTGERWKQLRKDLLPLFSPDKMKAIHPLVEDVCYNLCLYLNGITGSELELNDLCARFTIEVISSCAFGIKSDAIHIPNSEFRQMALEMLDPSPCQAVVTMTLIQFPWIFHCLPQSYLPEKVSNFFHYCVHQVVTLREREGNKRSDLMSVLIQLKKEGKLGIKSKKHCRLVSGVNKENLTTKGSTYAWGPESIDDVAAQAFGFIFGGLETCTTVISFALFELAHYPEIQKKLRKKINEVKFKHGGKLSYEALEEIHYLEMVILETLRKYPPVSFLARLTTKPFKFPIPEEKSSESIEEKLVTLEVGIPVVIPVLGLHRDPKYYPDPEIFDPKRFSKEVSSQRDPFTFLPFGEGPRVCVGRRFGLMLSKAAIATIVLSFELMPSGNTLLPITFDPTQFHTSSKNKLHVYIRKLKS
ncbi:cytochrome P450 6j1-like [Hetaerina americana]|uniref:cytochrome P450 6j1-like n=1 Tax=Hetaerina americana TaxID=62018 RepID=UPI003A7F3F7A